MSPALSRRIARSVLDGDHAGGQTNFRRTTPTVNFSTETMPAARRTLDTDGNLPERIAGMPMCSAIAFRKLSAVYSSDYLLGWDECNAQFGVFIQKRSHNLQQCFCGGPLRWSECAHRRFGLLCCSSSCLRCSYGRCNCWICTHNWYRHFNRRVCTTPRQFVPHHFVRSLAR